MRVVIVGATGNVGTSVVKALGEAPEVEEIVGLARRRPSWTPAKTSWVEADILSADLRGIFAGADAVIHLAWAIQPSRDERTLERINIDGSRRVFDAVAAAGTPKLVYASSVGAYARGPKDEEVGESWQIGATASSFYSRHKVAVEHMLDEFEARLPGVKVVRLRPALIFKGEAASEIRRLFAGPFLPSFLVRPGLVPAVPKIPGLRFQAVHSADVGRAYALASTRDVEGAFNIAAEPPIGADELGQVLDARTFPLPAAVARALTDVTWRLRLQPTPPGWLDMALNVPLMSSVRARGELGWEPRFSSLQALEELLEGLREGEGFPTPTLEEPEAGGRLNEVRTGVGGRQWLHDPEEQLIKYLADAHSIEEQALTQLRAAPKIAGEGRLAAILHRHLAETEVQERRVGERLAAHNVGPSTVKDLAGKMGGVGMLLFAGSQPDTPGKLTAHAFSYEHMELAAYELLRRVAEQAGDEETARMASEIAEEERRMGQRLADCFDAAVDASLEDSGAADLDRQLDRYLADAHAIEQQAKVLLSSAPGLVEDELLERAMAGHLRETEEHERLVSERLQARGASPSKLEDTALAAGGFNIGGFFGAQPDTTIKVAGFAYAFEHLEIAAYELLRRVAERAGDAETVAIAERILPQERAAAEKLSKSWDRTAVAG